MTTPSAPERVQHFDQQYADTPPWDIGRPQQLYRRLVDAGEIRGPVLDIGCGTGEQVLLFAAVGLEAMGIDFAPAAIDAARRKAADRRIVAEFAVHDALDLPALGRSFATVTDMGLYHCIAPDDVPRFVDGVRRVLEPGGVYHLLCFSEHETRPGGPRRVAQAELREAFAVGFAVESITPETLESRSHNGGIRGWYAKIRTVDPQMNTDGHR